jgi:hypothetical protein
MNQPVDVVDIVDAENDVVTVYFHQSTKMPVRQSFYRRNPKTRERIEEVTEYGKFRDVGGGVMWPLTVMRTRDGDKIYQMYADRSPSRRSPVTACSCCRRGSKY